MATATKSKRRNKKESNSPKVWKEFNSRLINTSEDLIDTTLSTGEKYQNLIAKSLKKGEPLIEKQVSIFFDTLEGLKEQYEFGSDRFKKLIEWKKIKKSANDRIDTIKKTANETVENVQAELKELNISWPGEKEEVKKSTKKNYTDLHQSSGSCTPWCNLTQIILKISVI